MALAPYFQPFSAAFIIAHSFCRCLPGIDSQCLFRIGLICLYSSMVTTETIRPFKMLNGTGV